MDFEFSIIQNGYTVCPDTWGMTDECATFHRIYYVRGGKAYLKQNGKDIQLDKDHLYIFPVMTPYTLWHEKADPLEVSWFHVEMDAGVTMNPGHMKIEHHTFLYHLLNSMIFLQREKHSFEDISLLFGVLLRNLDDYFQFNQYKSKRMKRVISYIEEHIQERPSVSELAGYIGMERSYFTRFFKDVYGMSPGHFIYTRKMSMGVKALLEGKTVMQAAVESGYTDEKAFSRAFKKYMEVSPGEYKKCHIQQP